MRSITTFLFAVLLAFAAVGTAHAGDIQVGDINIDGLKCGGCPGVVAIDIKNRGNALRGGYTVWVELKVTPQARPGAAKTYKEQIRGGFQEDETKTITFRDIKINSCNQEATAFNVRAYVTGGNYRDPNTRNNTKRMATPVRNRCPRSGGSGSGSGSQSGGNDAGGGHSSVALPDLYPTYFRPSSSMCCGGDAHSIRVPVKNKGKHSIQEPVELRLAVTSPDGDTKTYNAKLPRGVAANRTQNASFRGVKFDACDGYYSFELMIDPENKIKEADESNNSATPRVRFNKQCQ